MAFVDRELLLITSNKLGWNEGKFALHEKCLWNPLLVLVVAGGLSTNKIPATGLKQGFVDFATYAVRLSTNKIPATGLKQGKTYPTLERSALSTNKIPATGLKHKFLQAGAVSNRIFQLIKSRQRD